MVKIDHKKIASTTLREQFPLGCRVRWNEQGLARCPGKSTLLATVVGYGRLYDTLVVVPLTGHTRDSWGAGFCERVPIPDGLDLDKIREAYAYNRLSKDDINSQLIAEVERLLEVVAALRKQLPTQE